MEAIGFPIAAALKVINEVTAPGEAWSGDIELRTLVLKEPAEDPMNEDISAAGSYTIQAIFTGESSAKPRNGLPYWVGTVRSAPTPYKI